MHTVIESTDSKFASYWRTLFANDPLQHPVYALQKFDRAVESENSQFTDRSFLVMSEEQPVFGCSLTLHTDEKGRRHMGYFGLEAATHVNRNSLEKPSNNFQPEAIRLLQEHTNFLIEDMQPDSLAYVDNVSCGIMSPVSQVLLEHGAQPTIQSTQIIDLTGSTRQILRNVRKSYRGYIRWGWENLTTEIIGGEVLNESSARFLQSLHLVETIPQQPDRDLWHTYEELVRKGSAFLVQSRLKNELVASSLFAYTENTCHYLTGSILEDCPNRPILHSAIWQAMMHSKQLGCEQFQLSDSASEPARNSENVVLAAGFGGEAHTRLKMKLNQ